MITKEELIEEIGWDNLRKRYNVLDENFRAKIGDCIIDCGAHFGDNSLYFATRVKEQGKVYAIEAEFVNFLTLKDWINKYKMENIITPIRLAISDKFGKRKLNDATTRSAFSFFKNNRSNDKYSLVKTNTLDNVVKKWKIKKLDAIYMNIEGAEYLAICGMDYILKNLKPFIYIADHFYITPNELTDTIDIQKILEENDYSVRIINETDKHRIIIGNPNV